jgi:hypothetical protein
LNAHAVRACASQGSHFVLFITALALADVDDDDDLDVVVGTNDGEIALVYNPDDPQAEWTASTEIDDFGEVSDIAAGDIDKDRGRRSDRYVALVRHRSLVGAARRQLRAARCRAELRWRRVARRWRCRWRLVGYRRGAGMLFHNDAAGGFDRVVLDRKIGDCNAALIADVDGSAPAELLFSDRGGDGEARMVRVWKRD